MYRHVNLFVGGTFPTQPKKTLNLTRQGLLKFTINNRKLQITMNIFLKQLKIYKKNADKYYVGKKTLAKKGLT